MSNASQSGSEHQVSQNPRQYIDKKPKQTNKPRVAKKVITPNTHPNAGTRPTPRGNATKKFGKNSASSRG